MLLELTFQAQHLLELDPEWLIPTTWQEEYANVLSKLYKKYKCNAQDVVKLFQYTCDNMQSREHEVETKDALVCAMQYQISVYDAHFVVLAEQSSSMLITENVEVLKKCPTLASSMRDFIKSQ